MNQSPPLLYTFQIRRSATMRCSVKMYMPLLWGLCVLFAKVSMTTSIPEAKKTNVTVKSNNATRQPTTAHVDVLQSTARTPENKPEDAPAEQAVSPVVANETKETTTVDTKSSSSNNSREGSVVVTAVSTSTSSTGLPASTEGLITRSEAPARARGAAEPSTAVSMATTETPPSTSMTRPTAEAKTPTGENTARVEPSTAVTTALMETQPSTGVTTAKDGMQPSLSMTTVTSRAQALNYTTTDALNDTAGQLLQSSTSSFTNKTATATATAYATVSLTSLQPTPITGNTSELPSTTSLNNLNVSIFNQNLSRPTESSPISKTSPELGSTHKSVSTTRLHNSTTGPSETASPTTTNSPNSTTGNSTSAVGILLPLKPKRLPVSTPRSTPAATISPCQTPKNPPSSQIQPCSTRGVANQCLVIIASLAALATIFMVSTIVLCVKLSARNYRGKKPQQSTEMMCISALLPEKTYTRQRNPVSNGVLVYPTGEDSDEEGGDNLTLSSFLPDNDRYI